MKPIVVARRCGVESSDEAIRDRLFEMLDDVDGLAERVHGMRRIAIKSNLGLLDGRLHRGRLCALTDPSVVEAVVAWLRAHTDAVLLVGDASTGIRCEEVCRAIGLTERLARHGAQIADYNDEPYTTFRTPGGGLMFSEYILSNEMRAADGIVSLAKMKSHVSTGVTLTLKNLFGIPPTSIYGCPRRYCHGPIRLPRVIADLGLVLKPMLCVIDGIVGQTHKEWYGEPLEAGWLVAGDNTVATDVVGMHLMGAKPDDDYPVAPYHFDRNPVKLAGDAGLGPLDISQIDLRGDALEPVPGFDSEVHVEEPVLNAIRRSVADQAGIYVDDRPQYVDQYGGRIIGLYGGQVIFVGDSVDKLQRRAEIAREHGDESGGLFLTRVVPAEREIETLSVYKSIRDGAAA